MTPHQALPGDHPASAVTHALRILHAIAAADTVQLERVQLLLLPSPTLLLEVLQHTSCL